MLNRRLFSFFFIALGFFLLPLSNAIGQSGNSVQAQVFQAAQTLSQSLQFPSGNDAPKFKSIALGTEFNLADKKLFHLGTGGNFNSLPWVCEIQSVTVDCKLVLWKGKSWPSNLSELSSAFGDEVRLTITLIPSAMSEHLSPSSLGLAKIIEISIVAKEPSGSIADNAIAYFQDNFKSKPMVENKYSSPSEIYSPQCKSIVAGVQGKRPSDVTPAEQRAADQCETNATLAFMSGKTISARNRVTTWITSDGVAKVKVSDSSIARSLPGTRINLDSKDFKIVFTMFDQPAIQDYIRTIKQIGVAAAAAEKTNKQKDF